MKEHKHHGYVWEQKLACRAPAGAVRCVLFLQAEDAGNPSRGSAMAMGLQLQDEDAPAAQDSLLPRDTLAIPPGRSGIMNEDRCNSEVVINELSADRICS